MGNQSSKGSSGTSTPRASASSTSLDRSAGPALASLPSFGKSDTQGSSRSFGGKIRSKIPGKATDSPRNSISVLNDGDKSESGSMKSGKSGLSKGTTLAEPNSPSESQAPSDSSPVEDPQPPPSPIQSASMGSGHHDVSAAQQSGEVDMISDQPPSGAVNPHSHLARAGKSILVRRDGQTSGQDGPTNNLMPSLLAVPDDKQLSSSAASTGMGMGKIDTMDLDDYITRLIDAAYAGKVTKGVCLKNAEIAAICAAAQEIFLSQPALLELDAPVKIVGDIHGQYPDLIRLFEMSGAPPAANFLFLGDYVDRGKQSLETILLLLCYKLKYPENFFLLRGNHECANVTRVYGFYDECKRRCNIKTWKTFIDTFNTLPIAAIVAEKIFCVHGGLSPSLSHMDDIKNIARPTDVPDYGLLNDLLWSDPADMDADWEANERGVSYCFGKKVIMQFLERHNFDLVCRAHMVVEDGYEFFNDRVLVTVFSAPNVS